MRFSEVGMALEGLGVSHRFIRSATRKHAVGGPDKRTPRQVVAELGLFIGEYISMSPENVPRRVRKIDKDNGEVFVDGLRKSVNVYAITKQG